MRVRACVVDGLGCLRRLEGRGCGEVSISGPAVEDDAEGEEDDGDDERAEQEDGWTTFVARKLFER